VDDAVLYRGAVDTGWTSATRASTSGCSASHADTVERRHVTQLMRLAAERLGPRDLPSEAELAAYLAAHAGTFAEPSTLSLTQVYFAADRHGPSLARDAQATAEAIRREKVSPADAVALGDAFVAGSTVRGTSRAQLEAVFGPEFAAGVWDAPDGTWIGPVRSTHGLHLCGLPSVLRHLPSPMWCAHASSSRCCTSAPRGERRAWSATRTLRGARGRS
jgi:hypothetical protein